ncbi:MAG: DDE-type integrase/transposase/recombinase [Pseudomonadota bacterium]
MVGFPLTARRDAKAAKAFLRKAIERVRLHRPVTICTDKAHAYRKVIREINHRYDPHFDSIRHIDRKGRNNLIESDHAALKRLLGYRQSFRSWNRQSHPRRYRDDPNHQTRPYPSQTTRRPKQTRPCNPCR